MKHVRDPRVIIAFLLLLVAVVFLAGTIRLIGTARAADQASILMKNGTGGAGSIQPVALASLPAPAKSELTGQVTPGPSETPGDTSGIIALAIVIVVTIILGAAIGVRDNPARKSSSR